MIDTHAHLHACADPPQELVERARAAGVDRILEVGASPDEWVEVERFCSETDGVFAILGIHPHEAGRADWQELERLREVESVAIGETGLDYYRDYAPHEAQRQLFQAHLAIAEALDRPVVIHSRAADGDVA
ncbi:MAG TPA: TatD family hydrolase, partial [Gaiellaceae bacterium]|nr:TatD family hydrolase [Gaiellaceae bacterium]